MTNLHKFGIPTDQTVIDNSRYYMSVPNLTKFLGEKDNGIIAKRAFSLIKTHNLNEADEIKRLNKTNYKEVLFVSEDLVYLIIMTIPNCQRAAKLRSMFIQILWSSNLTMTLPFPEDQIGEIILTVEAAKKNLNYLSNELKKNLSA